jgi:hypothetical protein
LAFEIFVGVEILAGGVDVGVAEELLGFEQTGYLENLQPVKSSNLILFPCNTDVNSVQFKAPLYIS